jgi:hypothetical protein
MALDINIQLFASGQQSGALGATAAGESDGRKSSLPLIAVVLGAKDARGWVDIFNAPGLFGNGTNGIGGIFTPKSGDKLLQAFQNTGSGNGTLGIGAIAIGGDSAEGNYFQSMVASSRGDSSERGV